MSVPLPYHIPVLRDPIINWLRETPPGIWVDGTTGGGGHLEAMLNAADLGRIVVGVDRDDDALAEAGARLEGRGAVFIKTSFADLRAALNAEGFGDHSVAGILVDLGVSSWQLDAPERGFGLKHSAGPLDMRMDQSSGGPTAGDLLRTLEPGPLATILRRNGEVPAPMRIARALIEAATDGSLKTTGDLAKVVDKAMPRAVWRKKNVHPATTVFQALRIEVNGELDALDTLLEEAPNLLCPGGRLAVLSYHSLEDRRVKQAFRLGQDGPKRPRQLPPPSDWHATWKILTRKPVRADDEEIARNPRARSARLRVGERPPLAPPIPSWRT